MTCQDSFHEVAFNISFWTRNISSARILFWRGVDSEQGLVPRVQLSDQSLLIKIGEVDFITAKKERKSLKECKS